MNPTAPSQIQNEPVSNRDVPESGLAGSPRSHLTNRPSLPESHRTVPFRSGASWFRKILAFAGPGYLVAVGYMDPGNWATDIQGGSKFGYTLLSVVLISNLMAMFLQALFAKLGIVTGQHLTQTCHDNYNLRTS